MDDCLLEDLGDYFVANNLLDKGWKFHEFVDEWQRGTVVMTKGWSKCAINIGRPGKLNM